MISEEFVDKLLYLIEILHQTTTTAAGAIGNVALYLIEILHQTTTWAQWAKILSGVVSYRNSTSNHNLLQINNVSHWVVSYRNSTSNHNRDVGVPGCFFVVSYRNSTSNHNHTSSRFLGFALYLIEILHQTTTRAFVLVRKQPLYLIEILHQTTTMSLVKIHAIRLYLIEILHQTTTLGRRSRHGPRCILSKFYIKPQPCFHVFDLVSVVSYRNSTSNHNVGPHIDW